MKYKLVYILWNDASEMSKWNTEEDIDEWLRANEKDAGLVEIVGWLLRETPLHIIISSMRAPENDYQDNHWGHLQKIPKTWIKKRRVLRIK